MKYLISYQTRWSLPAPILNRGVEVERTTSTYTNLFAFVYI